MSNFDDNSQFSGGRGPVEDKTIRVNLAEDADPIPVRGVDADNAPQTVQPVSVSGKAVDQDAYTPGYTVDDNASLAIDKDTGNLLTHDLENATRIGNLTETAPASDTASSGLNGRLQRIAQNITSLIARLPTSLGQKTKAASLAVTIASDQEEITNNSTTASTFAQATKTVAAAATPEALVASPTLVQTVEIFPLDTNSGDIYVGDASGQLRLVDQGVGFTFEAASGKKIDINTIYIKVTVDDDAVTYTTLN